MSLHTDHQARVAPAPRVSVIMAVYNGARYLTRAVESILTQTFADFEFVIVDDGSTDETPLILASFQDPRIVLLTNERNLGLTKSLNIGIRASSGEFIARQDADDASLPDRLRRQAAYLDAHPTTALVGAGSRWVDENDSVIQEWRPPPDHTAIQQTLLWTNPFIHGSFLIRRCCLDDIGGYNEAQAFAQDTDLLYRISEPWDVDGLSDILYIHRRHGDSISTRRRSDQEHCHQAALQAAIRRRLAYGRGRLGLTGAQMPEWVRSADRRWLAQRFAWWSAAARVLSRSLAFQFLCVALLLDPTAPSIWQYVRGVVSRKIGYV